jgi:hypothetical protein
VAALKAFAALGVLLELHAERVQALEHLAERVGELAVPFYRTHRQPAALFGEREPQIARRFFERARRVRKLAAFPGADRGFDDGLARERDHLGRRHAFAEEERRGFRNLVRFVEDDRVARGEKLAYAFVAQDEVGEKKMVVDDDHVGFEGTLARLHHEAAVEMRAVGAEAVFARRGDLRPHHRRFGDTAAFGTVAGGADARKALHLA